MNKNRGQIFDSKPNEILGNLWIWQNPLISMCEGLNFGVLLSSVER